MFHIDFNGIDCTMPDSLQSKLEGYLTIWEAEYDITSVPDFNPASRFEQIIKAAYERSGRGLDRRI